MANLKTNKGTLGRVLHRVKRHAPLLILSLALGAVAVILTQYLPRLIGQAIDELLARVRWIWSVSFPF